MSNRVISIMGCGWLGFPLAEKMVEDGWIVKGSTTTKDKIQLMEQAGIIPFYITANPEPTGDRVDNFFQADILYWNIPPGLRGGEQDLELFRQQTQAILNLVRKSPITHVVYVSSTSVYPDTPGIKTEKDAENPESIAGKALLETEAILLKETGFATTIMRMGGLFGAGRHPARYLSGRTNVAKPHAPVNMIHLADALTASEAVIQAQPAGEIFNVVSDFHPSRKEFYGNACEKLGIPPPEFERSERTGKLISNAHLVSTLDIRFLNPEV